MTKFTLAAWSQIVIANVYVAAGIKPMAYAFVAMSVISFILDGFISHKNNKTGDSK